jgi:hypothetical protein
MWGIFWGKSLAQKIAKPIRRRMTERGRSEQRNRLWRAMAHGAALYQVLLV